MMARNCWCALAPPPLPSLPVCLSVLILFLSFFPLLLCSPYLQDSRRDLRTHIELRVLTLPRYKPKISMEHSGPGAFGALVASPYDEVHRSEFIFDLLEEFNNMCEYDAPPHRAGISFPRAASSARQSRCVSDRRLPTAGVPTNRNSFASH